ncbi:MAG: RHS repeat-associated core domain-containing protein [Flavobacterium sp.]
MPPGSQQLYKYKYNGKEWQDELGLSMTAMDFRQYDSAIGRFINIDPLADIDGQIDVSPYSFAWNNPIVFNDPSGLCPECEQNVKDPTAGQTYNTSTGATYTYNNGQWTRTDIENTLNEVVITPKSDTSTAEKVADVATDFIPIVGSVKDIYRGARDGDGLQLAMGIGFLIFDIATLGSGSLLKGGVKTLGKELLEEGAEQGLKSASRIWEVGAYKNLRGVEAGLEAHHVGQKAVMGKLVPGYVMSEAPSILVPKLGHTSGKNVLSRSVSGFNNARQLLARDIFELRRVYPNIPNASLEKLIEMNKSMYPSSFLKP